MKKILAFTLFLILCSCSTQLYIPTESSATISVSELKKGRELYVDNCASCHQLYAPKAYDAIAWQHNLDEMQPKAKITNEQKKMIYDYLVNAPK